MLRLKSDKMEVLFLGPDSTLGIECDLNLDEVVPPQKDQVHSLTVLLDSALLLDQHVAAMAMGTFHQFRLLFRHSGEEGSRHSHSEGFCTVHTSPPRGVMNDIRVGGGALAWRIRPKKA